MFPKRLNLFFWLLLFSLSSEASPETLQSWELPVDASFLPLCLKSAGINEGVAWEGLICRPHLRTPADVSRRTTWFHYRKIPIDKQAIF